jgi:hypothetical protein
MQYLRASVLQMMTGFLAWLVWVSVHIQFLAEGSLRFRVFFQ